MIPRLQNLNKQFEPQIARQKLQPTTDIWESMGLDQFLRPEIVTKRKALNKCLEDIYDDLKPYYINKAIPWFALKRLQELKIHGAHVKDFGGPGMTNAEVGAMEYELGKKDASLATYYVVHNMLGSNVINELGDEEQRARILPETINMDKSVCFCLTEPDYGSDATSLETSATKVEGGYIINGQKRWPGLATVADYHVVWAKNVSDNNNVQGFIVTKGSKGLSTSAIEDKYSLPMVHNANIKYDKVFVPANNHLHRAKSFATGTNVVLEKSRLQVAWIEAGIAAGAYEAALKYCLKRKQFGKPIAKFQLIQEKLSRMLSLCEMMNSNLIIMSQAMDKGQNTMGQIARAKAQCGLCAREVCAMAREVCGGNGIILDNHVMKQYMDLEGVYTYEGTYEINALVSGRELTGGLAAIKPK